MGTEMGMEKWKKHNREVADILEKHRPEKEYADRTPEASAPMEAEVKRGKHRCIACGQPVKYIFFANHRFCKQCRETRNDEIDYLQAFLRIQVWITKFNRANIELYDMELIGNEWNFCWKSPVRMGGRKKKKKIKCKKFMRRDVIEVNMIYAYVQLWIREKRKEKGNWKAWKKKGKWKGGSIKKIPYWYMTQYLYFFGKTEQAEMMSQRWKRSKRKEEIFFIDRNGSDDRNQYTEMLTKHPLSGLDKE